MILRTILFLIVNFGALALGALFTGEGVPSDWYTNLNKAPWTPPGWVFGAAWTTIMILFSVYMALLWNKVANKKLLLGIFILQFVLNVAWNPIFFHFNNAAFGLVVIVLLTILVWFFFFKYFRKLHWASLLILPYGIWLLIATSLNAYILLMN
jgi:tryptophan-rich sensory protein